jgi:hypothetical protein
LSKTLLILICPVACARAIEIATKLFKTYHSALLLLVKKEEAHEVAEN